MPSFHHDAARVALLGAVGAALLTAVLSGGCAPDENPTTRPAKLSNRTDKALADPFGYSPDFDRTDISGGGIGSYDKEGMNRDVDHVLNP
jgi:hypothetical protein